MKSINFIFFLWLILAGCQSITDGGGSGYRGHSNGVEWTIIEVNGQEFLFAWKDGAGGLTRYDR